MFAGEGDREAVEGAFLKRRALGESERPPPSRRYAAIHLPREHAWEEKTKLVRIDALNFSSRVSALVWLMKKTLALNNSN